jgi:hypothetical protein
MASVVVGGAGEVVDLSKNTAVTTPAGQSVGVGDTAVITPSASRPFKGRYTLIRVLESGAETDTVVTFKAGPTGGTPANQAVYGDLVLPALTNGQDQVVQLELSRFQQADGTIHAAVSGTATGAATFSVFSLSKSA